MFSKEIGPDAGCSVPGSLTATPKIARVTQIDAIT
jgi:hypothetical protein